MVPISVIITIENDTWVLKHYSTLVVPINLYEYSILFTIIIDPFKATISSHSLYFYSYCSAQNPKS